MSDDLPLGRSFIRPKYAASTVLPISQNVTVEERSPLYLNIAFLLGLPALLLMIILACVWYWPATVEFIETESDLPNWFAHVCGFGASLSELGLFIDKNTLFVWNAMMFLHRLGRGVLQGQRLQRLQHYLRAHPILFPMQLFIALIAVIGSYLYFVKAEEVLPDWAHGNALAAIIPVDTFIIKYMSFHLGFSEWFEKVAKLIRGRPRWQQLSILAANMTLGVYGSFYVYGKTYLSFAPSLGDIPATSLGVVAMLPTAAMTGTALIRSGTSIGSAVARGACLAPKTLFWLLTVGIFITFASACAGIANADVMRDYWDIWILTLGTTLLSTFLKIDCLAAVYDKAQNALPSVSTISNVACSFWRREKSIPSIGRVPSTDTANATSHSLDTFNEPS